jgi:hypothetical protein
MADAIYSARRRAAATIIGLVVSVVLAGTAVTPAEASATICDQSANNYQQQCLYVNATGTYVYYIEYWAYGYPYTNAYGSAGVDAEMSWVAPNGQRQYFDACGGSGCVPLGYYDHRIDINQNLPNNSIVWANLFCFGGACDPGGPIARVQATVHS